MTKTTCIYTSLTSVSTCQGNSVNFIVCHNIMPDHDYTFSLSQLIYYRIARVEILQWVVCKLTASLILFPSDCLIVRIQVKVIQSSSSAFSHQSCSKKCWLWVMWKWYWPAVERFSLKLEYEKISEHFGLLPHCINNKLILCWQ